MICILHGYLLEGSGSNLWTRSVIQSLCRRGEIIHLVCQENHPDRYDFIAVAYQYMLDGGTQTMTQREVPYAGRCVMHKPQLREPLPVYVWDKYEEFSRVVPMIELPDAEINAYLDRNVEVISKIVHEQGISVLHANHAVLMSVVAQRVSEKRSIPFAVMPHGSAIEYAVKKDPRMFDYAKEAFTTCDRVFVIGNEIRKRLLDLFPAEVGLQDKMLELNLGADTSLFEPLPNSLRANNIAKLKASVAGLARGKSPSASERMVQALRADVTLEEMKRLLSTAGEYNAKCPDEVLEAKLEAVDWDGGQILLFVGRLIASKGIQSVLAALPSLFAEHPKLRLVVVGHGPLREPLEALLWAFEFGHRDLIRRIAQWGRALEGGPARPFEGMLHFLGQLQARGEMAEYVEKARRSLRPERVVFTGYLTHNELRYLFPCCDLAIFPSVVKEAGPLVFLEALASGVYPLGTYFGGMGASIDLVSEFLPPDDAQWMKLSAEPENTVADIVSNVSGALRLGHQYQQTLRDLAVKRFDWTNVSAKLAAELQGLQKGASRQQV